MELQSFGQGHGWLKAGFQGFQGSGKTFTAISLAIGAYKHFGLTGRIAMFDTEGGGEFINSRVKAATGLDLVGGKGRSLKSLMDVARKIEADGLKVFIVDSVTHIWTELCRSYLEEINTILVSRKKPKRNRLEFQDWGPIKERWQEWTDWYLNSPVHVIICGRAGFTYDYEINEDTHRRELIKTGTRMKAEGEFGFEPSLLIEMTQLRGDAGITIEAFVIKDRFNAINGQTIENPTFESFLPHIKLLVPGASNAIDTTTKTEFGIGDDMLDNSRRYRQQCEIALEEIQGELYRTFPSQSAEHKSARLEATEAIFHTRSWKAIEIMKLQLLQDGLERLRRHQGREADVDKALGQQAGPADADRMQFDDEISALGERVIGKSPTSPAAQNDPVVNGSSPTAEQPQSTFAKSIASAIAPVTNDSMPIGGAANELSPDLTDFKRLIDEVQKHAPPILGRVAVKGMVRSWCAALPDAPRPEDTTLEQRRVLLEAVRAGRFDFQIGSIRQAA